MVGTTIHVRDLKERESVVSEARAHFLALSQPSLRPILVLERTAFATIFVYEPAPAKKNHDYVYVNGARKRCGIALVQRYDIHPEAAQELCFHRDHNITKPGPV